MALSNIADVTRSVITLIDWALRRSGDWPVGGSPSVLPLPPDKMSTDGLSVFLYHVQENVYNKNMHLPSAGPGQIPVQSAPMGLNLFYQISARSAAENPADADVFQEQLMMSIALQALHDYAEINDHTILDEPPPAADIRVLDRLGLGGRTNRFKMTMQPIPHNDSVHFWTAGQAPLRLAAYYEVSIVFLEPKKVPLPVGRVLTYGTYLFTGGAPQITDSQNTLVFTIPGEASPRKIDLSPARVPTGGTLELIGSGFNGDDVQLQLLNAALPNPLPPVDNAWNLTMLGEGRLSVIVQETIGAVAVVPGMYTVQVIVTRRRLAPRGEIKAFTYVSNQFSVTISPRIDSVSLLASSRVRVRGYLFQHPNLPADAVDVYVGANRLVRRTAAGNPVAGEFRITAANEVVVSLAGLTTGEVLPLRLLVAGAESPPNWVTIP